MRLVIEGSDETILGMADISGSRWRIVNDLFVSDQDIYVTIARDGLLSTLCFKNEAGCIASFGKFTGSALGARVAAGNELVVRAGEGMIELSPRPADVGFGR